MATAKTRKGHTADVIKAIQGSFKKNTIKTMAEAEGASEVIPTGISVLDNYVLGCGGLPAGRMIELFSDPDIGKTSLGLQFLAAAQAAGGLGLYFESENTFEPARAPIFGVNMDEVVLTEDASAEDFIGMMRAGLNSIPKNVGPNVLVWDSLAATSMADQIEKSGSKSIGKKARLMSDELPVVARLAREKRTAVVIINQTRHKIGVMFGDPVTTPGGQTAKFQSAARLQLWRGKAFDKGGTLLGHRVTVKAVKNKFAKPHKKAVIRLDYDTGWNDEWAIFNLAKDLGVLSDGAKLSKANMEKALEGLKSEPEWYSGGGAK